MKKINGNLKLKKKTAYLAKSVFGSKMREPTHKDSAMRVTNGLGVTEGVICKRLRYKMGENWEYLKVVGGVKRNKENRSTYRGPRRSRAEHDKWRYRGGEYRCRQCYQLESDDTTRRRTPSLCCSHSLWTGGGGNGQRCRLLLDNWPNTLFS